MSPAASGVAEHESRPSSSMPGSFGAGSMRSTRRKRPQAPADLEVAELGGLANGSDGTGPIQQSQQGPLVLRERQGLESLLRFGLESKPRVEVPEATLDPRDGLDAPDPLEDDVAGPDLERDGLFRGGAGGSST